jgi:hypothetical protein
MKCKQALQILALGLLLVVAGANLVDINDSIAHEEITKSNAHAASSMNPEKRDTTASGSAAELPQHELLATFYADSNQLLSYSEFRERYYTVSGIQAQVD